MRPYNDALALSLVVIHKCSVIRHTHREAGIHCHGWLQDNFAVAEELLTVKVLPGCLLTLVENALKHGFKGRPAPYQLDVSAQAEGENLLLKVTDNGRGMTPERLAELGKCPVQSENKGGGVLLHQLLQSLRLIFGESVELSFDSAVGQGTVARLHQAKRSEP